jgi:hypothetical protein
MWMSATSVHEAVRAWAGIDGIAEADARETIDDVGERRQLFERCGDEAE